MHGREGSRLTPEQHQTIIDLWSRHIWWSEEETAAQWQAQGIAVSVYQVHLVGQMAWGLDDDTIRCPHGGTRHVRRKSRQLRMKRSLDEQGQEQTVAVYRYSGTNPDCPHQTCTTLPPDLVPYSRHRAQMRVLALQTSELGRGTYRTTARGPGLSTATAYRWMTAGGSALLPIVQLFGVVRSRGVVGVDEKWVKVPINDKPAGKHRHWMYVYMTVDVWSYDLLHIAIFQNVGKASARVFLQQLRAKGYHPQVIVTDLSQDYADPIAQMFPQAEHHECVFHALKAWLETLREGYGADYRKKHADARALQHDLDRIFRAHTKRTA